MTKIPIAAALFLASLAAAAQAQPFDGRETRSVVVPHADLDVSTEAGLHELNQRIDRAASRVCGGTDQIRILWQQRLYNNCKRDAIASTRNSHAYAMAVRNNPAALADAGPARTKTLASR